MRWELFLWPVPFNPLHAHPSFQPHDALVAPFCHFHHTRCYVHLWGCCLRTDWWDFIWSRRQGFSQPRHKYLGLQYESYYRAQRRVLKQLCAEIVGSEIVHRIFRPQRRPWEERFVTFFFDLNSSLTFHVTIAKDNPKSVKKSPVKGKAKWKLSIIVPYCMEFCTNYVPITANRTW